MMLGDPFGRKDEPGDLPGRGHARRACRVLALAVGAGVLVGKEVVGPAMEPFQLLALVVILVLAVVSYVL